MRLWKRRSLSKAQNLRGCERVRARVCVCEGVVEEAEVSKDTPPLPLLSLDGAGRRNI